jgi:hypothetical protein
MSSRRSPTDYENILLSLSLVGDWTEFMKFPDQGTTIATGDRAGDRAVQGVRFLDASGNLMLLFTDGQDTQVTDHGKHVSEIVAGAVQAKIPVYMIRTSYNKRSARCAGRHLEAGDRSDRRQVLPRAGDEATI